MRFNPFIFIPAALLLGVAIGYAFTPAAAPAPEPLPTATTHAVTPMQAVPTPIATIKFNYKPVGTPPTTATLVLDLIINNAATGSEVNEAKIWVNGVEVPQGERRIIISFTNGQTKFLRLQVAAEGFKAIDRVLRMKVLYNRRETLTLFLEPLQVN